jgi:hypothetical protein
MPFTEVKRVTPNLDEVAALQGAHAGRLPGNKDLSIRAQEGLRAAHLNDTMSRQNGIVFEQVDIALLAAADRR